MATPIPQNLMIGNMLQTQWGDYLEVQQLTTKDVIFYVVNRDRFPLPDGWEAYPIPLSHDVLVNNLGFSKLDTLNGKSKSFKAIYQSPNAHDFGLLLTDDDKYYLPGVDGFLVDVNTLQTLHVGMTGGKLLPFKP